MKGIKISELERGIISNKIIIPCSIYDESTYETKSLDILSFVDFINGYLVDGTGISIVKQSDGKYKINCTIDTSLFVISSSLPVENIDQNKIYLVPNEDGKYTKYIYDNENWINIGEEETDIVLDDFYNKSEIDNKLEVLLNNVESKLSLKYSKPSNGISLDDLSEEVKESLSKADSALQEHQDISDLASKEFVRSEIEAVDHSMYLTEHQDISGLASKEFVRSEIEAVDHSMYLTEHQDISGLASKKFVEDSIAAVDHSMYLTEHQDISGLASKTYVEEKISEIEHPSVDVSKFLTRDQIIELIQEYINTGEIGKDDPSDDPVEPISGVVYYGSTGNNDTLTVDLLSTLNTVPSEGISKSNYETGNNEWLVIPESWGELNTLGENDNIKVEIINNLGQRVFPFQVDNDSVIPEYIIYWYDKNTFNNYNITLK